MSERVGRICLTELSSPEGLPAAPFDAGSGLLRTTLVDAIGYSRFKHGDAAVARRFAVALAALAAQRLPNRPVLVTTSAFAQVPPAAYSLLAPFVQHLRMLRPELKVGMFRVVRRGVSNGDYAQMTIADRRGAIGAGDLTPERDLAGAFVLALDDIRVTGNHELAMDRCLVAAGVAEVWHLYVVDAAGFAGCPQIESVLNEAAVDGVTSLLEIAASPRFRPNARLCRRVLALPPVQLADFVRHADPSLLGWLDAAIVHDGLAAVPAYEGGVRVWDQVRSDSSPAVDAGAG